MNWKYGSSVCGMLRVNVFYIKQSLQTRSCIQARNWLHSHCCLWGRCVLLSSKALYCRMLWDQYCDKSAISSKLHVFKYIFFYSLPLRWTCFRYIQCSLPSISPFCSHVVCICVTVVITWFQHFEIVFFLKFLQDNCLLSIFHVSCDLFCFICFVS